MSEVLDYIREKDPRFKDVSDEDLTLFIGSKKPDFLKNDTFKEDFQKAAATKSLDIAMKGTGDVLKILTNPAAGEASEMGREEAQAGRLKAGMDLATQTTSKVADMIGKGAIATPTNEEWAEQQVQNQLRKDIQEKGPSAALAQVRHAQTKQAAEGVGVLTTPLAEIFPKITGDQLEKILGLISTSMPMAVARERAAGAAPEDKEAEPGMHPEKLLTPEARNLVRGVAGVEQGLADQANFFTSPLGIATLGIGNLPAPIAKLVGVAFTAQMASQLPGHSEAISDELHSEEPDYEKIFKNSTDAVSALGFTIAGGLHLFEPVIRAARARAAYTKALKEAFPVAPATTGALSAQIGSEYMGAGPFLPPTRIPEAPQRPPAGGEQGGEAPPEAKRRIKAAVEKTLRKPFEQGKTDAQKGVTENPYAEGSPQATAWEGGQKAFKQSEEKGTTNAKGTGAEVATGREQKTPEVAKEEEGRVRVRDDEKHRLETEQGEVTPRQTIDTIVGADQATFSEMVGNKAEVHAKQTGASITDPKDLEALYDARKKLKEQFDSLEAEIKNAKGAGRADTVMRLMQDRLDVSFKQQWVSEAIEGATGHADASKMEKTRKILGEDWKPKFPPRHPELDEFEEAQNPFKAFSDASARWANQLTDWTKGQPENKPIIFQTEHSTYAVTKDPSGKWRYTSFSNSDHMPVGHQEFKTREEAVEDLLRSNSKAQLLDKMPFQVEPMPVHAFPGDEVMWTEPGKEPQLVKFRGYSREPGKAFIEDPEVAGQSKTVQSMELGPKPKPVEKAIQENIAKVEEKRAAAKAEEAPKAPETPETPIAPEKPKTPGRSANVIRTDIRKTEQKIKDLQSAKRDYEKSGAKGPAARTQDKIREAQNKLTELQQELGAAEPQSDKRVGQAMRRFNQQTQEGGPDILSHINETGKLMSWSQFKTKAKQKGQEWFNQNKSLYDDIRNVKLPPHINAAIFGGEELPDTVAQRMANDNKISDANPSALWEEIKQATKKRQGKGKSEAPQTDKFDQWSQATQPAEGKTEVDPQLIVKGDKWIVDGQEVRVIGRTPDGDITIDGGEKFGQLELPEGEPIWVDAVVETAPEGEAEFLPEEEGSAPSPASPESQQESTPLKFTEGQKVWVGQEPMHREGVISGSGPKRDGVQQYFVKTNLGEVAYNESDIRQREEPIPETPKKGTGGELFTREDIPFSLTQETAKTGAAETSKTAAAEQGDLLGGAPPKQESPALEKPKVEERPLTDAEQEEFLELSKKYRKNREENGPPLTTEETQRYELLTALAGQKDFGFAEPTGVEALKGKIKALASQIDRLDENAPKGSGKKVKEYLEKREQLHREMRAAMDQLTEGKGEMIYTSDPKEAPSGYFTRKEFRVRQLDDDEVQDRWRSPSERMEVFKVAGTRPFVAESRRIEFEDAEGTKEAGRGNWYAEGYGKTRDGAIGDARGRENSSWSKIPEDAIKAKEAPPKVESPVPVSTQKYRIGTNPTLYTLLERLEQSASEKANNEQPVRVRNENSGKEEIVMESDLKAVKERTLDEKEKGKAGKRDLDKELRDLGLDPSVFKTKAEKQAAIIRENQKKQGPGTPHITQPPDPKAQIEQLNDALGNIRGRRVPISERVKAMFDLGKKLAAAKDLVTETIAGLKTTGDYLIDKWQGYNQVDDLVRAKGELSAEIEKNGWRMKQFVKAIERAVPDPMERAAIAKWVDAGGDMEKLIAGYEEAPDRFKQHYLDAMDLSGDLLVGAMNIRNYFEARLQEAIDAGVLEDGVEDYIHRIYEKTPDLEKKMMGYVQGGLLKTNPALAKKRIFDHDWEAEKLGYNVVQDFLPRITEYEAALTRAIASRKFVRKVVGYKDANGNKIPGMLAPDGRPVVDIAGLGIPVNDAEGIREASLIDPSYQRKATQTTEIDPATGQPVTEENPLTNREDYQARNQYKVFRNWKWAVNDGEGNPVYVKGDLMIHPDYVRRFDSLLEPSRIRYAQSPTLRFLGRSALGVGGFVKQSMLDLSGFHQVQMAVHGAEHRVYTLPGEVPSGLKALGFEKIFENINLNDPVIDGLLKGGLTLGGDYRYSREGLVGSSLTRAIPVMGDIMNTYHSWLFQDFIPRLKSTMAREAFDRNMKAYQKDIQTGRRSVDDIYSMTASQANAAFGELNQITLERSKTMQDALRIIFLAPDFLEARGRFALQAMKKGGGDIGTAEYWKRGGPITNNEQRMALAFGALGLWGMARIANIMLDGQMHNEPENLFSVVYKGRSYGLRTVQGDILHLMTHPVQFWMSRLNPLFGRTLLEAAAGRDYFGRKRSPLEQVWDMVSTVIPASLRHSQEHTIWESLLNAGGVTSRRFSDVDDAFKLAQKWKDKHGVGMKGEFIYDPNKDQLRPLKLALSNGDEGGAVRAIKNLIDKKQTTLPKLDTYFTRYADMPFAGSQDNDKKFFQTLSNDQKKTVEAARQHKKAMRKLYLEAKGKYHAAMNGPAPKIDTEIPEQ